MPSTATMTPLEQTTEAVLAHPVEVVPGRAHSGMVLLCDHASNFVPDDLAALGLPQAQFERHIGYDIGAAVVTRELAHLTGAPAVLTRFSRLVIDPNRGRDDPTLVMRLSDGAVVPGNARIDDAGIAERLRRFYEPYDAAIVAAIGAMTNAGQVPAIVSIHSFTPVWRGIPRPWEIGLLYDRDRRLHDALMGELRQNSSLCVGDNEPYFGGLPGDTIDRHATANGFANTLIELRQDLIAAPDDARAWARRLAPMLERAVQQAAGIKSGEARA